MNNISDNYTNTNSLTIVFRAYITELAAQFGEQDLVVNFRMKGVGIHFEKGFSTDYSESCVWLTPFIKPPGDLLRLLQVYQIFRIWLGLGLKTQA